MNDEYYNFRSGGGELSGTIEYELPSNYTLKITRYCIVCRSEITNPSESICPDCKEAILWAKKKMKEELK